MRVLFAIVLFLWSSIAVADDLPRKEIDALNLCMYRNGLLGIRLGLKPRDMRKSVNSVCEREKDGLIRAMMPKGDPNVFSVDVEGAEMEYEKAKKSSLLKFVIEDFIVKYSEAFQSVR